MARQHLTSKKQNDRCWSVMLGYGARTRGEQAKDRSQMLVDAWRWRTLTCRAGERMIDDAR
jgi:hypothetical protein